MSNNKIMVILSYLKSKHCFLIIYINCKISSSKLINLNNASILTFFFPFHMWFGLIIFLNNFPINNLWIKFVKCLPYSQIDNLSKVSLVNFVSLIIDYYYKKDLYVELYIDTTIKFNRK